MITLTPETAKRVLASIESRTPEEAAHEYRVGLEAIRPYTDRNASRALAVLECLSRTKAKLEKYERNMAVLRQIASKHA